MKSPALETSETPAAVVTTQHHQRSLFSLWFGCVCVLAACCIIPSLQLANIMGTALSPDTALQSRYRTFCASAVFKCRSIISSAAPRTQFPLCLPDCFSSSTPLCATVNDSVGSLSSISTGVTSLFSSIVFPPFLLFPTSTVSLLVSSVRTLLHNLSHTSLALPYKFYDISCSSAWQPSFFHSFFCCLPLSVASVYSGLSKLSVSSVQLPHALSTAAAAVPSDVRTSTPRGGPIHHSGFTSSSDESSLYTIENTVQGGGRKASVDTTEIRGQNPLRPLSISSSLPSSPSSDSGLPAEAWQQFYARFRDPAPSPAGVIDLDAVTWDLFVDAVTSPPQAPFDEKTTTHQDESHLQHGEQQEQEQQKQKQEKEKHQEEQPETQQRSQQEQSERPLTLGAATAADIEKLEHATMSTLPPRLWLVAFVASGCSHCARLRSVLEQVQELYTTKLQRLRAARRRALARSQQKATEALSAAAARTAAAHSELLQLSEGTVREDIIKVAEQHIVRLQQEEQQLQQKLLLQVSQLYSAAATAAWTYPDIVFVSFDCMQNNDHQHLCEHVFKISRFPTVVLLRKLPSLTTLRARHADHTSLQLSDSAECLWSRYHNSAFSDTEANTGEERRISNFMSFPLLRERLGYQTETRKPAIGGANGMQKEERGKRMPCVIQKEMLAEFPLFAMPSSQTLLLFLYGAAAEAASWAPFVPPPASVLELLLRSAVPSSVDSILEVASANVPSSAGRASEKRGHHPPSAIQKAAAAVAQQAAAQAAAAGAASAAATVLERERRHKNSNSFTAWLSNHMRGEALREVFSVEEIRLLHYGVATATAARSPSGDCSSPTVSFILCVDLPRILQTERGEASALRLPPLYVPHPDQQYVAHQHQFQQHQQQQWGRFRGGDGSVGAPNVRLDGLRGAFETFATAAGELRLQHLFMYSFDPTACASQVLKGKRVWAVATPQESLLHVRQQSAATKIPREAEATLRASITTGATPSAAKGASSQVVSNDNDKYGGEYQQQEYPLRVAALQPGLLLQGIGDDDDRHSGENACYEKEEEPATSGEAESRSSSRYEGKTQDLATASEQYVHDDEGEEKRESHDRDHRRKLLLLQHILESIWTAQHTLVSKQRQQRALREADIEREEKTGGDSMRKDRKEGGRCRRQEGGAQQHSNGRCVVDPPSEEQEKKEQKRQSERHRDKPYEYHQYLEQHFSEVCCFLEENGKLDAMEVPIFVGPFPPRLDQLNKTTASFGGGPAAAAASVYAGVPSPSLASFIDVFRLPTLPLIGDRNFMQLRVSSSASWLPAASTVYSTGRRNAGNKSTDSSSREDIPLVGRRQLVVAVLDLRVLSTLLTLYNRSQVAAAVAEAVRQQQQEAGAAAAAKQEHSTEAIGISSGSTDHDGEILSKPGKESYQSNVEPQGHRPKESSQGDSSFTGSAARKSVQSGEGNTSSSSSTFENKRSVRGWLGASSVFSWLQSFILTGGIEGGEVGITQQGAGPSSSSSSVSKEHVSPAVGTRVESVAAALAARETLVESEAATRVAAGNGVAASPQGHAVTAAAQRFVDLVEELWHLSWTAREVLLRSGVDLLEPLRARNGEGSNSQYGSQRTSTGTSSTTRGSRRPLFAFTSPFIFGVLDGYDYSEALTSYDVNVDTEGELPAILAFDPVLPPSVSVADATRTASSSSSSTCNNSGRHSTAASRSSGEERSTPDDRDESGSVEAGACRSPSGGNVSSSDSTTCSTGKAEGNGESTAAPAKGKSAKERMQSRNGVFEPYYYRDRLRLRLEELPQGLHLLRMRELKSRRLEQEEEDEDDFVGNTFFILPGGLIRGFVRVGKRVVSWIRKEYKAASHSRLALLRLIFSLIAFFLILACTAILVLYTICWPSKDATEEGEEEGADSEANTAATEDDETESDEEDDDDANEEWQRRVENDTRENASQQNGTVASTQEIVSPNTYSKYDGEKTVPRVHGDEMNHRKRTHSGEECHSNNTVCVDGVDSSVTGSNSNSTSDVKFSEAPPTLSIEEVRRRAGKLLRKRR